MLPREAFRAPEASTARCDERGDFISAYSGSPESTTRLAGRYIPWRLRNIWQIWRKFLRLKCPASISDCSRRSIVGQ